MSRDFDGATSILDGGASTSYSLGQAFTVTGWFNTDTQGGANEGRLWFAASTGDISLGWNGTAASKILRFKQRYTVIDINPAVDGIWDMTTGFPVLTGWKFAALTFDSTVMTTDPTLYLLEPDQGTGLQTLTVGSGLTKVQTPYGAATGASTLTIGSAGSLAGRVFDGRIGEVSAWAAVLTAAEIAAIAYHGVLVRPGMTQYLPMDNKTTQDLHDYSGNGNDGFVTAGTMPAAENPPIRPCGRRG